MPVLLKHEVAEVRLHFNNSDRRSKQLLESFKTQGRTEEARIYEGQCAQVEQFHADILAKLEKDLEGK